jgi:hypothetical protein
MPFNTGNPRYPNNQMGSRNNSNKWSNNNNNNNWSDWNNSRGVWNRSNNNTDFQNNRQRPYNQHSQHQSRNQYSQHQSRNQHRNRSNSNNRNSSYNSNRSVSNNGQRSVSNNRGDTDFQKLVAAVIQQLGLNNNGQQPHNGHQQQPSGGQQQKPTTNVRFSHTNQHHTYPNRSSTDDEFNSTNNDFQEMWRTLFKIVQMQHHLGNWTQLPASIKRNLTNIAEDITPPEPSDNLKEEINTILNRAGDHIQRSVCNHLTDRLERNKVKLQNLNPKDKERAIDVAHKHLSRRIGKKTTNIRQKLEEASCRIGNLWEDPERENQGFTKSKTPAKRARTEVEDTPSPASTRNRYQILGGTEAMETLEETQSFHVQAASTTASIQPTTTVTAPVESTIQLQTSNANAKKQRLPKKTTIESKKDLIFTIPEDTNVLVVGDSNLRNTEEDLIPDGMHVLVLPGAGILRATQAIKALPNHTLGQIILAVGLNDRGSAMEKINEDISFMRETVLVQKRRLTTVGISINQNLPQHERDTMKEINRFLQYNSECYVAGRTDVTCRENDQIHYSENTRKDIWASIVRNAFFPPKN